MAIWQDFKVFWAPGAAVVAGTVAALSGSGHADVTQARPPVAAVAAPADHPDVAESPAAVDDWNPFLTDPMPGDEGAEDDTSAPLAGEVLEQIDVGKYSYLRLGRGQEPAVWTAVPKTTARQGQRVAVKNAELMTNFVSASLKRTFDAIYFGTLADEGDAPASADGHDRQTGGAHPGPGKDADSVSVGKVSRAKGPLGRTVAELTHAAADAAGKRARVHGVVVKSTPGVMGRTFLHLRDGSGAAADGSNDLTVTSSAEPAVGTDVVLEGTVRTDADFGSGYRYPVLLADATVVTD